MTSSEPVDPDDTTISSSNLGPRDSDQQATRSGDFSYLPLEASGPAGESESSLAGGNYGRPRTTNASLWLL